VIVSAIGGLCNRLRVVLSYRAVGVSQFVWGRDAEICGGYFLDVFEPLAGVEWLDEGASVTTFDPCRDAPSGWERAYQELVLRDGMPSLARPYSAVHIRRTDHVGLAKSMGRYTSDDDFRGWLKVAPGPIYIATDNRHTQLVFRDYVRTLGKWSLFYNEIPASEEQRHTTFRHAAVDLFACAGAEHFMGSGESSFSNTARMLHAMGGWWS